MCREEVGKVIDCQIKKRTGPPSGDAAFINGEADHFHERFRERRRQNRRTSVTSVIAQHHVRNRARDSGLQSI
jgi:hypothetical protein